MTHRLFEPVAAAPARADATGIEWTMRGDSQRMMRSVVPTQSLA